MTSSDQRSFGRQRPVGRVQISLKSRARCLPSCDWPACGLGGEEPCAWQCPRKASQECGEGTGDRREQEEEGKPGRGGENSGHLSSGRSRSCSCLSYKRWQESRPDSGGGRFSGWRTDGTSSTSGTLKNGSVTSKFCDLWQNKYCPLKVEGEGTRLQTTRNL